LSGDVGKPGLWVRAIADERFRVALIADPLRALAEFPDVDVSADQVRQLDELSVEEREELVRQVFRNAHFKGGQARFGAIGFDGRLGGEPPAPPG
jgi:hypothetical protein